MADDDDPLPTDATDAEPEPKSASVHPIGLQLARAKLPRHATFFISVGVGLIVFVLLVWLMPKFAVVAGAISMFVVYLGLIALLLPALDADFLRSRADDADAPTGLIFLAVLIVVGVCCGTLFTALNSQGTPAALEVGMSVASVLLGWFVIHTMAAMHYAYEFYETGDDPEKALDGGHVGGLDFPEGDKPDGMAFLYFAYVIGVAFAVSDIAILSPKMRKIVTIHSVFSYFFNTLIVAATINVAVAVGGQG